MVQEMEQKINRLVELFIEDYQGGKVIDPQGNATRVEAAQMMKNFLESMVK